MGELEAVCSWPNAIVAKSIESKKTNGRERITGASTRKNVDGIVYEHAPSDVLRLGMTPQSWLYNASLLAGLMHAGTDTAVIPSKKDAMPKVGLFIPCYVDQFYPQVAVATLRLLQRLGLEVEFPQEQTCCGQPMANSGCSEYARPLAERFLRIFAKYDHVIAPSGSCVSMVRNHYTQSLEGQADFDRLRTNTFELCEYLTDILRVTSVEGDFRRKVGLHMSCHGLRELRLARSSELMVESFNKVRFLLGQLRGIELVELSRPDECCGFGGTFAVNEEAVSCLMGRDRIADHERGGAEVITGFDASCLMHLEGLIRREKKPLRVMHVAEILEGASLS